ncbi:hypothetical protein QOT17_015016 [Balamuthia mandrillaris]
MVNDMLKAVCDFVNDAALKDGLVGVLKEDINSFYEVGDVGSLMLKAANNNHTPEKVKEGKESLFFNSPPYVVNTPYHAADTLFIERLLFSPSTQPTSLNSFSFSSKILTDLPAYNPEHDSDPEPFLQQLENNLQIVNLHPSMWNMALAKYTQGSKITSHWMAPRCLAKSTPANTTMATTMGPPHLLPHHQDILCPPTNTPAISAQHPGILVISVNPTSL